MSKLNILLVTRNRLSALIESLFSIKRIASSTLNTFDIQVTIQDNSDYSMPEHVLAYFSKYLDLSYFKTDSVLPMSKNWNLGIQHALLCQPDYIVVLADRRLMSSNIFYAMKFLEETADPFICFDHQDVWINSQAILRRNHSYKFISQSYTDLCAAIGSAQVSWYQPMLFNCVIKSSFLRSIFDTYGSYAEGSSPDMNHLARIADMGLGSYFIYDAPCIITNARHAARSNGSSALNSGTINQTEHARLSGIECYPPYMDNFVSANITGSLARYWNESRLRSLIDPIKFFSSCLLELSYPKSLEAFAKMADSLCRYVDDFSLGSDAKNAISQVSHRPAHSQSYPLDATDCLYNSPNLQRLSIIEL